MHMRLEELEEQAAEVQKQAEEVVLVVQVDLVDH